MKLYQSKIPTIAQKIIKQLTDREEIEVSDVTEAELDIQSVLKEYLRLDRELSDKAKDLLETRKLNYGAFSKIKRQAAEEIGFGLGEDGIIWICNQILETFMQSQFVEEIFADDATLRRGIKEILTQHMMVDEELDVEVRNRIKNLEEGTSNWDVEYSKIMNQMKQNRGLKE